MPQLTPDEITAYTAFAHRLADAARVETLRDMDFAVTDKAANGEYDPVTEADRAAERAMRALIEREFADDGICGEEYGDKPARGPLSWSLDPIDGTRSFICGLPTWTILIGLLSEGAPVIGLIDAPRLNERFIGTGTETHLHSGEERRRLTTSGCVRLAEARLSTTDPFLFGEDEAGGFDRLRRAARTTRYGHDAYAYARLAAGSIDLVVESGLKPHDYNALIPVVRGAGGVIGNWRGEDDFAEGKVVAAATRALFEEAIAQLRA